MSRTVQPFEMFRIQHFPRICGMFGASRCVIKHSKR